MDVKYVKCLYTGLTVATDLITLAGTVEAGDILNPAGTKATAASTVVIGIAQEGGVSGAVIPYLPMLPGMVFEAKTEDIVIVGELVGIKIEGTTNRQILDDAATIKLFRATKAGAAEALVTFVTMPSMAAADAIA